MCIRSTLLTTAGMISTGVVMKSIIFCMTPVHVVSMTKIFFENSTEIEVLREDFKKLYSEILTGTDEQIRERLLDDYCLSEDTIDGLEEIGFANIATTFKEMDEEAEDNGDYIYFSWF